MEERKPAKRRGAKRMAVATALLLALLASGVLPESVEQSLREVAAVIAGQT